MNWGVTVGQKNSITLPSLVRSGPFDLCFERVECTFRSIGIICGSVSLRKHQLSLWYAAASSCFSGLSPLPKYSPSHPPLSTRTHTHTRKQTDNEIPETQGDEDGSYGNNVKMGKPPPVSERVCVCVCAWIKEPICSPVMKTIDCSRHLLAAVDGGIDPSHVDSGSPCRR